jgi:hypothetical protein
VEGLEMGEEKREEGLGKGEEGRRVGKRGKDERWEKVRELRAGEMGRVKGGRRLKSEEKGKG